jgi:site-specific recombinase XerD
LNYNKITNPENVTIDVIEKYLIFLLNERKVSASHYKHVVRGLTVLFNEIYNKNFKTLNLVKAPKRIRIPVVLSKQEINRILDNVSNMKHKAIFITIYSAGLRVDEAVKLTKDSIESDRNLIKVIGKGNKERYSILAKYTVEFLREYWRKYRPLKWLFPSAQYKTKPLSARTVQKEFKKAVLKAGITKKGVVVHTLRHSFGTHLYEAGVDLRTIQELMGHTTPTTTAMYVHVSKRMISNVLSPMDSFNERTENK